MQGEKDILRRTMYVVRQYYDSNTVVHTLQRLSDIYVGQSPCTTALKSMCVSHILLSITKFIFSAYLLWIDYLLSPAEVVGN